MDTSRNMGPIGIKPFPVTEDYKIKPGDRCDLVLIIQVMLGTLKMYYDDFGAVCAGGVFDDATQEAVRCFQRIGGIPETGCVDAETWNRMAEEFNAAVCQNQ